jgi:CheY-like chemotaxis protein
MTANVSHDVPRAPTRALLVDDDEFMLSFVGNMLHDLGVREVRTAKDGKSGLQAFASASRKPEVVLCDLNMPHADGFQMMEMLAECEYKGGVILVSGMDERTRSSATLMARFHRLNILDTIGKPVDKRQLARALAKLA